MTITAAARVAILTAERYRCTKVRLVHDLDTGEWSVRAEGIQC